VGLAVELDEYDLGVSDERVDRSDSGIARQAGQIFIAPTQTKVRLREGLEDSLLA
jgi:hypothetical protein